VTIDDLRRDAVTRTLFPPTSLAIAIRKLGFVQADPIRAPARAQDLTLRHRVRNYAAGDLERRYPSLPVEEGFFINYGFLTRADYLRIPRRGLRGWTAANRRRAAAILEFVRERGTVHPRDVDAEFRFGRATNYWGGTSNATTRLLDQMHHRGLLRVARRDRGVRVYAAEPGAPAGSEASDIDQQLDALIDILIGKYGPMPAASLGVTAARLRWAAPAFARKLPAAILRARRRSAHARVDGTDWYWTAGDRPERTDEAGDRVLLLSPFDPIVWDRRRFEMLWGWRYRFEAYTPAPKRKLGYYALPMLFRDRIIGWANVSRAGSAMACEPGFVNGKPADPAFARAFEAEIARLEKFLAGGRN
jgi:uncharacterized protein YcaQ